MATGPVPGAFGITGRYVIQNGAMRLGLSPCGVRRGGGHALEATEKHPRDRIAGEDQHLVLAHLRDGGILEAMTPISAADFARAIIMPNLVPPVVTGAQAAAYRERILQAIPEGGAWEGVDHGERGGHGVVIL